MVVHGAHLAIAAVIFLVTLSLVIWQPRGLGIGWSALGGAAIALVSGVVSLHDVVTVWDIVWNATFTFIAVIIISLLLDGAGFFKWAALHVARSARGNGRLLFVLVIVLGAVVAAFFANDGAALILTPIVLEMLLALGYSPSASFAFVMATGFVADTTSLPLVVSNLVNIVSADYFHIGFARFALVMAPVDLAAIAASLGVLWIYFHRRIPKSYPLAEIEEPSHAITDHLTFRVGWVVLGLVLAGYFLAHLASIPISAIAGAGALLLAAVAGRWWNARAKTSGEENVAPTESTLSGNEQVPVTRPVELSSTGSLIAPGKHDRDPLALSPSTSNPSIAEHDRDLRSVSPWRSSPSISVGRIIRSAPWQVVLFSVGMYVVVFGMAEAGLTSLVASGLNHISSDGNGVVALVAGYGAAILASAMNNMPSVLVGALGIHASHATSHARQVMLFANVIGNDLGPKLTPIGSLATLLWLHVLNRRGIHIGWGQYTKIGIVLTLPVLAVTLLTLAGWLRVVR